MRDALIDQTLGRKRTTMLLMVVLVAFGLVARFSISIEANPQIDVPVFVISVVHEGISPEDATQLLILPLESELSSIEGIDEIHAYGSEGAATVMAEFDVDANLNEALLDVREAVDRAKVKFPATAEEPIVSEQSTSDFPILQINITAKGASERMLYSLAKDLQSQLEPIPLILEAEIRGNREDLLEITIDPSELDAYEITLDQLMGTLQRNTRLIPAGSLESGEGRISVKIPSVIEEAQDLWELPVKVDGDVVVTLKDVAKVARAFKDRDNIARVNGVDSITLNIYKRLTANEIDTANAAKAVVDEWRVTAPKQVNVFYSQDQAPYALRQVRELEGNVLTALVIVMVLVVGSMGLRSGIIVGAAIPVSFLFSLIIVWLMGLTFNFMVLFGMLLGLGMLIDGAIVITEYADRKMVEGHSRDEAYALAAKRMFWPVTASVATTLAAFFPLMFWPGVSGKFMSYLPITVFAVLSGSLLYALCFGPVLGSIFGKAGTLTERSKERMYVLEYSDPTKLKSITGWYARLVRISTKYAWLTVALTVFALVVSFAMYNAKQLGMIFFDSDPTFARVLIHARGNLTIEQSSDLVREIESRIVHVPGVESMNSYSNVGYVGFFGPSTTAQDVIGTIFVELADQAERKLTGSETLEVIRERTADVVGVVIEVNEMEQGPPVGKPVQLEFSSSYRELIPPVLNVVRAYIDTEMNGLRDVEDSRAIRGVQWKIAVDRAQAAIFNADVTLVGMAVQLVTNGIFMGEYRPDDVDEAVDIRVRYPAEKRGLNRLDEMRIPTSQGLVPMSNFVRREPVDNVPQIQRRDRKHVFEIQANVEEGVLADAKVRELSAWLATQQFDPRVDIRFRGANEEQQNSIAFVIQAFLFALCLMFVLLVTQFNSLYQSFLILFSVVMSTAGVLLGLVITNEPFSAILTGIGIVALAGIVVNNNIVLIDTYNQLRRDHPELDYLSLIVRTGAQRFRPVMLTTCTTVMGLLPLATNISMDFVNGEVIVNSTVSSFWVPLAQAIVFGLTFATLLTLVCTPAMLAFPHQFKNLGRLIAARWRARSAREPEVAPT
ncbi:MAG: efflux RND transporter permease subunit [Gammaproteobacteria bacterium]|nr:efflux RND transporter permease subunit [Gammaproteobacteria bacterium]